MKFFDLNRKLSNTILAPTNGLSNFVVHTVVKRKTVVMFPIVKTQVYLAKCKPALILSFLKKYLCYHVWNLIVLCVPITLGIKSLRQGVERAMLIKLPLIDQWKLFWGILLLYEAFLQLKRERSIFYQITYI